MSKTCAKCGTHYNEVPKTATLHLDAIAPGWYFNCPCHSTLVWPHKKRELSDCAVGCVFALLYIAVVVIASFIGAK